jgi:hypothetical protein
MNRRQFVGRVSLGVAAACTVFPEKSSAAPASDLTVRFIGMMGFVEREDRSFLVATPGQSHHMTHTPFLMARKGSSIAKALEMAPAKGVVPGAFDTQLDGSAPSQFVYRRLDNSALDIVSGSEARVVNNTTEMAQMSQISPGKRLRGNLEKWASSTISLRGGRIEDSSAHPDAGKVWAFGNYRQKLTDAVNFQAGGNVSTTIRLTGTSAVKTVTLPAGAREELWVISAVAPRMTEGGDPTMIEHSELLFEFMVDATTLVATCPDATGREVPATELPFVTPTSASTGIVASESSMPPATELCFLACWLLGTTAGN